jgi:hypothetical protein
MTGVCSVEGCGRTTYSPTAQLCRKHYLRKWRTGPVELRNRPTLIEQILGSQAYYGRQKVLTATLVAGWHAPTYTEMTRVEYEARP